MNLSSLFGEIQVDGRRETISFQVTKRLVLQEPTGSR